MQLAPKLASWGLFERMRAFQILACDWEGHAGTKS